MKKPRKEQGQTDDGFAQISTKVVKLNTQIKVPS